MFSDSHPFFLIFLAAARCLLFPAKRTRVRFLRARSPTQKDGGGQGGEGVHAGPRATRVLRGRVTAAESPGRAGGAHLHGDPVTAADAVPAPRCARDTHAPPAPLRMPIPSLNS